ncbi:hypothetical protein ACHZ97_09385 [Lysobacter soli]|uniref:hypothetical protein n=1 Tax=Lysobacter soli TaxID=453783 RepID=UPI0037C87C6C
MSGRAKTPAQRKRSTYLAPIRARGARGNNLWFVTPPQDSSESSLTLCSDLEFETFLYLEGSPDLSHVDYGPLRREEAAPGPASRHFATATTLDGTRLDIELGPERVEPSVPGRRLINLSILNAGQVRIQSWRAIVPAINRCRAHSLNPVIFRCRRLLEERHELTAGELCAQLASEHTALVVGALAKMLRAREIESDVDQQLWGARTWFRLRRHG